MNTVLQQDLAHAKAEVQRSIEKVKETCVQYSRGEITLAEVKWTLQAATQMIETQCALIGDLAICQGIE